MILFRKKVFFSLISTFTLFRSARATADGLTNLTLKWPNYPTNPPLSLTHTLIHIISLSLSLFLTSFSHIAQTLSLSHAQKLSQPHTHCRSKSTQYAKKKNIWMSLNLKRKLLVNNYRAWETNLFSGKIYLTLNVGKKPFLFLHLQHKTLIIYATKAMLFC